MRISRSFKTEVSAVSLGTAVSGIGERRIGAVPDFAPYARKGTFTL
jgi:hypothetical protein